MSRQVNTTSSGDTKDGIFALRLNQALGSTTSEAFARQIDKSWRTVQRWRSDHSKPSGADLVLVAQTLNRDPAWFFTPPEEMPEEAAA